MRGWEGAVRRQLHPLLRLVPRSVPLALPHSCPLPCRPHVSACRVLQTLHALHDTLPNTHVVLLALLPRGGGTTGYRWPSLFTQPFEIVNAHFRWVCGGQLGAGGCGAVVVRWVRGVGLGMHVPTLGG